MTHPRSDAPALFVSHGAPTAALEDSTWSRALRDLGRAHADLRAIVVLSAHAERPWPVRVGAAATNRTVHDFGGFARDLYALRYDAPGDPTLAAEIVGLLAAAGLEARLDAALGLDHGAWVPLRHLRPTADVPVVPLSLPTPRAPEEVMAMGRALAPLRARGVLLVGSGGVVHDLSRLAWDDAAAPVAPWAAEFDAWVADALARGDDAALREHRARAPGSRDAAPTTEHLDPLFFVLGARRPGDRVETLCAELRHASLSMRTFALKGASS